MGGCLTYEARRFAVEQSRYDADVVDDEAAAPDEALELRRSAQLREPIPVAADKNEAVEVPTVRLEDRDLEALDLALLLEFAVVGQRFSEDLGCLDLASSSGLPEAKE